MLVDGVNLKQSVKNHNYAVIVAGGKGTRLWPLSRKEMPKQMQKFVSDKSLIEETIERISNVVPMENICIATTEQYATALRGMLDTIPDENFIIEPHSRGTTAAFALFSEVLYRRDPKAVIISIASDHVVSNLESFHLAIKNAFDFTNRTPNSITLLGVLPTFGDPGLGYIKLDKRISTDPVVYTAEKFVEKPSRSVAEKYVESGEYLWNAAYYCFKAKTLIDAYGEADSLVVSGIHRYLETGNPEDFNKVPLKAQEIEFINANKFPIYAMPGSFEWSDIGNWGALHDIIKKAEKNNNQTKDATNHIDIESLDCLVIAQNEQRVVATVGLRGIVVVDTDDALLILNKENTEDLKKVIDVMNKRGLDNYL
ncbi:MAG: Mannose-phosphate guanylyltransferase [Patescibacteria group bacterium]|nr:Mannose-phosphate guanylyltransferase [Patescibacteria group bacterium]